MSHLSVLHISCNCEECLTILNVELMVTVKREAELRFLNSSSSFKPPRCTEKSNGLPAMYLMVTAVDYIMVMVVVLPGEIGWWYLVFCNNALQGDCVSWLGCKHSRSQN